MAFFLIILDQLTKILITNNLTLGETIVVNNFFNITYVHNYGAAFSLFANYSFSRYLLPIISIIAVIGISFIIVKTKKSNILRLSALTLILAGAFGNLIDRSLNGFVVDFISLHYKMYYFAVFNLADSMISIAVILWLFSKND